MKPTHNVQPVCKYDAICLLFSFIKEFKVGRDTNTEAVNDGFGDGSIGRVKKGYDGMTYEREGKRHSRRHLHLMLEDADAAENVRLWKLLGSVQELLKGACAHAHTNDAVTSAINYSLLLLFAQEVLLS